ncbi:MAG TPA: DNA repair protein RadC [bacterium]|nr:DNA repair protein RadC [bacterium]
MDKKGHNGVGHRQRLRDRFLRTGLEGFSEHEIVELLLTLAIPRRDVKPAAKELVRRFGGLRGLLDASIEDVRAVPGIGEVAPVALKIVRETAALYLRKEGESAPFLGDVGKLVDFWRMRIGGLRHEAVQVAYLDAGYRLIREGVETLAEGTVDRAALYPRRVVESALRRGAAAIVLAHNHPNGVSTPSDADTVLTRAIVRALDTVSIRLLDHIIVAGDTHFSFRNAGLL